MGKSSSAGWFALLAFAACSRSGGSAPAPFVGPDGGTVSSADGRLTVTVPAGALGENLPISIEASPDPASAQAIGITYRLSPAGLFFRKNFSLSLAYDVAALGDGGTASLVVAFFADGGAIPLASTVDTDAGRVTSTVTHFAPLGLVHAAPLTTRTAVANLLRDVYVPSLWTRAVLISGPENMLQPGDEVRERYASITTDVTLSPESAIWPIDASVAASGDAGAVDGGVADGGFFADDAPPPIPITKPTWFFWVDLMPFAGYTRQSVFLFVDPTTGTFTEYKSSAFPVINGDDFVVEAQTRVDSALTVYNADAGTTADIVPPVSAASLSQALSEGYQSLEDETGTVRSTSRPLECACVGNLVLIIYTADESKLRADARAVEAYMRSPSGAGFGQDEVKLIYAPTATALAEALVKAIRSDKNCWCEVLIYLASHGWRKGPGPRDKNAVAPPGGKAQEWSLLSFEMIAYLLKLVCSLKFTLVMEECSSGTLHNNITRGRANALKAVQQGDDAEKKKWGHYLCLDIQIISSAADSLEAYAGFPSSLTDLESILRSGDYTSAFTETWLNNLKSRASSGGGGSASSRDFAGAGNDAVSGSTGYFSGVLKYQKPQSIRYTKDPNAENCCVCCVGDGGSNTLPPGDGDAGTDAGVDAGASVACGWQSASALSIAGATGVGEPVALLSSTASVTASTGPFILAWPQAEVTRPSSQVWTAAREDGGWAPAQVLSDAGAMGVWNVHGASLPSGAAVTAWEQFWGGVAGVMTSVRDYVTRAWNRGPFYAVAGGTVKPRVAASANGDVAVLWKNGAQVTAAVFRGSLGPAGDGGVWSDAGIAGTSTADPPKVVVDDNGNFLTVWLNYDDVNRYDLRASAYSAAGQAWTDQGIIATNSANYPIVFDMARFGASELRVVYSNSAGTQDWWLAERRVAFPVMSWTSEARLTTRDGGGLEGFSLSANTDGGAVLVYAWDIPGTWVGPMAVDALLFSGAWGAPARLSTSDGGPFILPRVALAGSGRAIAAYRLTDGTARLRAHLYEPGSGWGAATTIAPDAGLFDVGIAGTNPSIAYSTGSALNFAECAAPQ